MKPFIDAEIFQVFAVALQSLIIVGVVYSGIGFARLAVITETYGAEPITILMKLSIPLELSWALSLSCTKISILLLYINVFPVSWVVRIVWATIVLIVAWTVGTILTDFLMCRPFAYRWDHTIPGGSCGNQAISFTVTGVINLVTNVIVLVIPMPLLYKLQIARYKKTMLIFIFGLAPG